MQVKIKKLHPDAVIPVYAKQGDSGFDLSIVAPTVVYPGVTQKLSVGLAFEIPEGYEMQVRPRSGLTAKTHLRVQLGTIDSGYRGEVNVIVDNIGNIEAVLPVGYKIAQGVICPVQRVEFVETDDLSHTERNTGGFGHTGV